MSVPKLSDSKMIKYVCIYVATTHIKLFGTFLSLHPDKNTDSDMSTHDLEVQKVDCEP